MDELERGALLALLGVLTGGVLVVLGQAIADRRLEQRLKRALLAEIEQNAVALEPFAHGATSLDPVPRVYRDAWAGAHVLGWPRQKFLSIAAFYVTADRYESLREMIVVRETGGTQVLHLRMNAQAIGKAALDFVDGAKKAAR